MPHILFISYDGLTDPLGQSQILPYLKGLTAHGYRFTIISCEKPVRFNLYSTKIHSLIAENPIRWEPLIYHRQPPVLSSVYDLYKIKQKARSIHLRDRVDMVHTRSGTPALAGLWLKEKFGIPFLNDVRDFYAPSRIDSGQWPQDKFLYRKVFQYFDRMEKRELGKSDGIVCLSEKAAKIIRNSPYYPEETRLQVIPCSVDMELFDPKKINADEQKKLREKSGLSESDVVFSYLGSVGTWYLADEMFTLFKEIRSQIQNAKLLVISPDEKQLILNMASGAGVSLENIVVTSAVRQEVPLLLSLSHYSLFFIKPCYSKQASSPTKLGEIMAMGIPVITNQGVGDVAEIVQNSNSGIVIKEFTVAAYQSAAKAINESEFNKKEIRCAARQYFDLQKAIELYSSIYQSTLCQAASVMEHERILHEKPLLVASLQTN